MQGRVGEWEMIMIMIPDRAKKGRVKTQDYLRLAKISDWPV